LQVLWQRGPSTVREVLESLNDLRPTGYTTALKLLQIMADKGIVTRDESRKSHVYEPQAPQQETQSKLVVDMARRAFGGSAAQLALYALKNAEPTPSELSALRSELDRLSEPAETPVG
jgi:predicted transcriptional regulator